MCGIFGVINVSDKPINLTELILSLAENSESRGQDATGVSFLDENNNIFIMKRPVRGGLFSIYLPSQIKLAMGHVRYATKGNPKNNINNHPFKSHLGNYALAHNGILYNLQNIRSENLVNKNPKIETDTYLSVQLIDNFLKANNNIELNIDAIKYMCERITGSYIFTLMDKKNNLYIVKYDNPIIIRYFTSYNIIIYASTKKILEDSLNIFKEFLNAEYQDIEIKDGQIMKIDINGDIEIVEFKPNANIKIIENNLYDNFYYDDFYNDDIIQECDACFTKNDVMEINGTYYKLCDECFEEYSLWNIDILSFLDLKWNEFNPKELNKKEFKKSKKNKSTNNKRAKWIDYKNIGWI